MNLEKRGHAFVRYADDRNVYVRTKRAGQRVTQTLRCLYARLRLRVNESKSAVAYVHTPRVFAALDKWIRHRLRALQLKHWKRPWPALIRTWVVPLSQRTLSHTWLSVWS